MGRPARVSPDRILAAAAAEFSARGYAGARVDRIARRARVNKAMLYYHFGSKQRLYRTLLRSTFAQVAVRLTQVADAGDRPEAMVDQAIAALVEVARDQPFFPAIMLREVAEGGTHLDRETLAAMSAVPQAFGAIVARGIAAGAFRPVHPLAAYFTTVAPLMLYLAAAPIRRELADARLLALPELDTFITHLQQTIRRALAHDPPPATARGRRGLDRTNV